MKLFYCVIMLNLVCVSCGSADKLVGGKKDYKQEYEKSVATYNETVDPQIYNSGSENTSIMRQDGKVLQPIRKVPQQL